MNLLKWLCKDSEPVKVAKVGSNLADELRKSTVDAEEQAWKEAQEWYEKSKSLMIDYCISRCKEESGKRFSDANVGLVCDHKGYDFTFELMNELVNRGLFVRIISRGFLNVSWE